MYTAAYSIVYALITALGMIVTENNSYVSHTGTSPIISNKTPVTWIFAPDGGKGKSTLEIFGYGEDEEEGGLSTEKYQWKIKHYKRCKLVQQSGGFPYKQNNPSIFATSTSS